MPSNGCSDGSACAYAGVVYKTYKALERVRCLKEVKVDGQSLDISSVVAVSRYAVEPRLDDGEVPSGRMNASVASLNKLINTGDTLYGVNTGFGGSADTRTSQAEILQSALLQHHQFGLLLRTDKGEQSLSSINAQSSHAMPSDWVKGTMVVRCNSVARGHSAVSLDVIKTILALVREELVPVIPLRGSISASGDLSPLSYIAGAVCGNPDIYVQSRTGAISAKAALQRIGIDPKVLGPKEGLGLMNGTALSAAVASLALYETHHITILSQVITAMAVEALLGNAGNYDDFFAETRPHKGQLESARTIRQFVQGSLLARGLNQVDDKSRDGGILYQDRYALRTASQWIGPQLEDLLLAQEQVTTELNSTTDNPLVDISGETAHHGGNFQAVSITSAMEKTRLSLQMIGKLLFAQSSELINATLSNGLPPNLAVDEPSSSYTMKGVDIGMASYMSELAFLANPVSSHVQSAEMHNQAVNSLAFLTTRFTSQSVDLVSLMSASCLYIVCQALDLRVLQSTFFQQLEPVLYTVNRDVFGRYLTAAAFDELHAQLWGHVQGTWLSTSTKDTRDRVNYTIDTGIGILAQSLFSKPDVPLYEASIAIKAWKPRACAILAETYATTRSWFLAEQNTADYLGLASKKLYIFVRRTLGVPFHKGLEDHPTPTEPTSADGRQKKTIGSWIGIIYESLRNGELHKPLMGCLLDAGLVADVKPADRTVEAIDKTIVDRHVDNVHEEWHW
ncbi:MAG: hypothetical protein Q9191_000369 [Dirinaria sp. TL-2023a]